MAESLSVINKEQVGESFVIGFAGELTEKKGLRTLLCAYTQVDKKIPAALLIVGDV